MTKAKRVTVVACVAAVMLLLTGAAFGKNIYYAIASSGVTVDYGAWYTPGMEFNESRVDAANASNDAEVQSRSGNDRYAYFALHKDADGTWHGDLLDWMAKDPALMAAEATNAEMRLGVAFHPDEAGVAIGQRSDKAHLHYLRDYDYWVADYDHFVKMLDDAVGIHVEEVNGYTSSMYMDDYGLNGDRPSVVVRKSTNAGGHILVIDFGKAGVLRLRLECGYQPIDVDDYWTVPDGPDPVPDNPDPDPDPGIGDPDPEPEGKNPNAGPQAQITDHSTPGYEDFGGGANHDSDTTVTDEPKSPDTYTPPAPPKSNDGGKGKGNSGGSGSGSSDNDGSTGTHSGSRTVDTDNGKTTDYGTIHVGDGQTHSDNNDNQAKNTHDTIIDGASRDENAGEIVEPE